ncbi:hypothetical protein ACFE04_009340 [Oxalis oulophora]
MFGKGFKFPQTEITDPDGWSEEELDNLWMGVRRHGECWEDVLNSPFLTFLEQRTKEELQAKWATQRPTAFGTIDTNEFIVAFREWESASKSPSVVEFQAFSSTSKVNQSKVHDKKHEESEVESKPKKRKSSD